MSVSEFQIATADGFKLRTLVYRVKDNSDPKPVVFERTPYFNINGVFWKKMWEGTARYYLSRGYNFVVQAIRGTGGSEGTYTIFNAQEIDDAYRAVSWIEGQEFSNGKIAAVGTSYDGFTALATACKNPPGLRVVLAGGAPTQLGTDAFMSSGVMSLDLLDYLRFNETGTGSIYTPGFRQLAIQKARHEPDLRNYDRLLFGVTLPDWERIADAYRDLTLPIWTERQIRDQLKGIRVPTYHISGMRMDGDMPDTVKNFEAASAGPHRSLHHLILGYWDHSGSTAYMDGSNLSPFMSSRFPALLDYYMKGVPTPYAHEPRVMMASNLGSAFIGSDDYPLPSLVKTTWYFHGGDRPTLGRLSSTPPDSGEASSVYHDEPDARNVTDPPQSVVFDRVITKDTPLLGEMSFDLYLRFDTPQTDVLIQPKWTSAAGQTRFLTSCPSGHRLIRSEDVYHLQLESCPMMGHLKVGDHLSLVITSNNFPDYARNTNNSPSDFFSHFTPAKVEILHTKAYPSQVVISTQR